MQQNEYEVIVIGAGISGIGASRVLTENGVQHLMLQCRDRIGGRIVSCEFDGVKVELGASFVHCPHYKDNRISKFIEETKLEKISANFNSQIYYYQNEKFLPNKFIEKAWQIYEQMKEYAENAAKKCEKDRSVEEVMQEFFKLRVDKQSEHVKNTVRWIVEIYSNIEGGDLSELSLKQYLEDKTQSSHDFLPVEGYSKVLSKIFQQCKPDIRFNHRVTAIDYCGELVKVITNKQTFRCKYVIASFPLGVLQSKKVNFTPDLPQIYSQKIVKMGNGVANKLFVSFEKPFWGKRKGWLNFIAKTKINRYPVAAILPQKNKNILCVFVSASHSIEINQLSDEEVVEDFLAFLNKFIKDDIQVRAFKMTRWEKDENSLGSYSFSRVHHDQTDYSEVMRKPIDKKIWLVGQHLHPEMNACAHAAYETGIWAAEQVQKLLRKVGEQHVTGI